ncbi:MAG: glycosyl transferase family 2, partial [uncultured bacterium]
MKLSIIIPVFNEEKTIAQVIKNVYAVEFENLTREIIIIDDGSSDKSLSEIKKGIAGKNGIRLIAQGKNQGKGAAVAAGIEEATGDYIIIQDADFEYDPNDIKKLVLPVLNNQAKVVYGTRLNRMPHLGKEEKRARFLLHYFGNRFLSLVTSALYGAWITDMETCYKLFP